MAMAYIVIDLHQPPPAPEQLDYLTAVLLRDGAEIRRTLDTMLAWARIKLAALPAYQEQRDVFNQLFSLDCPPDTLPAIVDVVTRLRFHDTSTP